MECTRYVREELPYENESNRFKITNRDFNRQYAHIYSTRLMKFQPLLQYRVLEKWGKKYETKKLVQLKPNEKAVVFGTIYKQQELKPSILREISDEHQLLPLPPKERYVSPSDVLILEDELQRILLVGTIQPGDFVTGVVLALLGFEDDSGKFNVEDICCADIPISKSSSILPSEPKYLALVSGFDIGSGHDSLLSIQEMVFTLMGKTGIPEVQKMMSQVSRLIIAGNSLSSATQDRSVLDKARYLLRNNMAASIEAIQQLDDFLFQLASSIPVDLMPGPHDPANYVLPQQPLHHCMLPQSYSCSTFQTVGNPYSCCIAGRIVTGTSGQPINDIRKNSMLETALDALEKTLEWRHMCPTAPDTLGCYPYKDDDPFIFDRCPDIYFAGNQDVFGDRLWKSAEGQSVRLISIPRFSETSTVVLVDIVSLECHTLSFGTETNK